MSDTRYWSKEFTAAFLEKYKELPCLWKIKSKEYLNKNLKNVAYEELVELCKTINPDENRDFVVKKIQGFRGSFRKEVKKIAESKRSGNGSEQVYEPSLWYFELLKFTIDQETPANSLCNIPETTDSIDGDDSIDVIHVQTNDETLEPEEYNTSLENTNFQSSSSKCFPPQKTLYKAKKKRTLADRQLEFMETCSKALTAESKIDEYDAVGVTVSAKLKRMDSKQSIYADCLINKILAKGLLGSLTPVTDLYEPPIIASNTMYDQTYNYNQQHNSCNSYSNSNQPPTPIHFNYPSTHFDTSATENKTNPQDS